MPPVVKIRQFLASKSGNTPGADAKVSTPLLGLKFQSRITTPTAASPLPSALNYPNALDTGRGLSQDAGAETLVDGWVPHQSGHETVTLSNFTLLRVPLLPEPGATRPAAPADPKAFIQRLHDLRKAGEGLLPAVSTRTTRLSSSRSHSSSTRPVGTTSSFYPDCHQPPPFGPLPSPVLSFTSPSKPVNWTLSSKSNAAAAVMPTTTPEPLPRTSYVSTSTYAGATPSLSDGWMQPGRSSSSLAGLRQQELKDTGGGFLTHFPDPRDVRTQRPPSTARGGAVAATCSTPLSSLRSMHRLQQLQRLQREGAHLVAAIYEAPAKARHGTSPAAK